MSSPLSNLVKHWYIPVIIGILYIIVGGWICSAPMATFAVFSLFFSIGFFVSGILEMVFAVSNRREFSSWGWSFLSGLVSLVFGIILLKNPGTSMLTLSVLISFWVLVRSFMAIGTSIELSKISNSGWGIQLFFGILSLFVGIILLLNPAFAALYLAYIIGFGIILLGFYHIAFGLKVKSFKK